MGTVVMFRIANSNHVEKSQSRYFRSAAFACVVSSLMLGGCAVNSNTLPQLANSNDLVTNSVAEQAKPEGVANTDAEVIKTAVSNADVNSNALAWRNPETGSSGTIVAIDKFMGKHGQRCRGFKTSVDTFMGISFYNGEACQISPGEWVLSWFKPSE